MDEGLKERFSSLTDKELIEITEGRLSQYYPSDAIEVAKSIMESRKVGSGETQKGDVATQDKTINPHLFTIFVWGFMVVGFFLTLANITIPLLPVAGILLAQIYFLICLYRCWSILQGSTARTTPGRAVGFLFIPIFNLYWAFPAVRGLAKDANAFLQMRAILEKRISVVLSTAISISIIVIQLLPSIVPFYLQQESKGTVFACIFYAIIILENILVYYWARFFNYSVKNLGVKYK